MSTVELAAAIVEARDELATALYARDLSACVVANYVSDRMGPDHLGDLEGVRPAVETYRRRNADYHAKRRAHDLLSRQARAEMSAVPA